MNYVGEWSFMNCITDIATKANIPLEQRQENFVTVNVNFGNGRMQRVWIRPFGLDSKNRHLINISSAAVVLPKGQMLGQAYANNLLKDNSRIMHGAWAIVEGDKEDYLVAMDTLIAETMEAEEFEASTFIVGLLADEIEKNSGHDAF